VRDLFERGLQALRQANRFDLALKLAEPAGKALEPNRAAVLRAEINADWGRAERAQGGLAGPHEEEARQHLLESARAYAQAADTAATPAAAADALWLAAACYQEAPDLAEAVVVLGRYLQLGPPAEKAGEGYYRRAEALRLLGRTEDADRDYHNCVAVAAVTPFAARAQYQLALGLLARGQVDQAEEILKENRKNLLINPDTEALEKTLFALGDLYFQRHTYREATDTLGEALTKFPNNPAAARARFHLAESYRQLGGLARKKFEVDEKMSDKMRQELKADHARFLRNGAKEFELLKDLLETPQGPAQLGPEEAAQVPFLLADCRFNLGEYDQALKLYNDLIGHYGRLMEDLARPAPPPADGGDRALAQNLAARRRLDALGGALRCHAFLDQPKEAQKRLEEIRQGLVAVDDAVRSEWETWLQGVATWLAKPPQREPTP
jgi:tetratricopeptide (TPR) repeat protein